HFCPFLTNNSHHLFPLFLECYERLERVFLWLRQIMSMVDSVERLAGILRLILRQVVICQNCTGIGHALQEIILKERSRIGQIALSMDSMITIPVLAVGDLSLLITKTINVLAQRLPGRVRTWWRIVLDEQFRVQDEALTENMLVHYPVHIFAALQRWVEW